MLNKDQILQLRQKHFLKNAVHYHQDPVQLVKAKGCYVYDETGKEYLDCIGGIVCISAGHNHPKIKAAIRKMLDEDAIQHTTTLYLSSYAAELAKALADEAPEGVDKVFFTNSGSEANEIAFMAARHATGETTVIHLRHSYHGATSGTQAACGHSSWRYRSQPVAGVSSAMEPYCYRCPFGKKPDSCALECAKNVETTIQTTTNGRVAAVVVEPIMGVGGFITPPEAYFKEVLEITHRYGGKYISDEVQTGAGRCGQRFLLSTELGIAADLVTMAKGLGNGAAIGAVMMKTEISEGLSGKLLLNTFGSDPYQTMQAKLTMDILKEENLIENAAAMGKLLKDGLETLMKSHQWIGDVRGRGLLLGFEMVKDRQTKEHATELTAQLMDRCKDKGLLVGKGGLKGNVIRLAPPLSLTASDANAVLRILDEVLTEMERSCRV